MFSVFILKVLTFFLQGTTSTEPQDPEPSTLEEVAHPQTVEPTEHTDPPPRLSSTASPPSDLGSAPGPAPAALEASCPPPADSPTQADRSAPAKKKKGFFSKGKKLFRKLGSSKRD